MILWLRTHPALWTADTLDRSVLYAQALALQNHPQFAAARQAYAYTIGKTMAGHWTLHKIMRGDAQFALMACVLYLHSRRDAAVPNSGVTVQRVIDLFEKAEQHGPHCKLASPTRIKAMLTLIRYLKGLVPAPLNDDHRSRLLVPTSCLIEPLRKTLGNFLRSVNIILPLEDDILRVPEALLAEVMSYNVYAFIYSGFTLHERFPEIQACMAREAGHQLFMLLIAGMSPQADGQILTKAPIDSLAQDYHISRGTIRNVLSDFAKKNYIEVDRGGHRISMSTEFVAICNQWIALELLWLYAFALLGWQHVQKSAENCSIA